MEKPRGKGAHPGMMRLAALGCLLLAVFCGPAAAGEWQTYLEDSFSTTQSMFYTGQAGEAFYAIDEEGRYVIDGMATSSDSLSALTEDLYYYYLEGKCELLRSTAGELAFTGLVFHYNKSIPGKLSYYVFYYYGDGYYGAKRVVGDQVDIIIPLTPTDALDMYGENILGVDAQGTRFDLYINGRYVDGFTDVRIDGGGFGFYISKYSKSAFDDFTVKVERRGGGLESTAAPAVAEGGNVADDTGGRVESGSRDFPEIPRDPNRPVYSWEVGVNKTGKPRPGYPEPEVEPEDVPEPESTGGTNDTNTGSRGSSGPTGEDDSDGLPPGVISSVSLRSANEPAPTANVRPSVTAPAEPDPEPPETEPVLEPVEVLDLSEVDLPPGEEMMTGTRELKNPPDVSDDEKLVVYTLPAADDGIGESLDVSPVTREEFRAAAPKLPAAKVPDVDVEYTDVPDPESSERLARFIEVEPDRVNGSAVANTTAEDAAGDSAAPVEGHPPTLSLAPAADEATATSNYTQTTGPAPTEATSPGPADDPGTEDGYRVAPPVPEGQRIVIPPRDELILLTPEEVYDEGPAEDAEPGPAPLDLTPAADDAARPAGATPVEAEADDGEPNDNVDAAEERRRIADRMRSNDNWGDDDVVVDYRIASALEGNDPAEAAPAVGQPEAETELEPLPAAEERDGAMDFGAQQPGPGPLDLHGEAATGNHTELTGDEIALSLTPRSEPTAAQPAARPFYAGPDLVEISDDFSTQLWPESTGGPTSYRYFGAAYEISNLEAQTMAISFQEAALADVEVLADVEFLEGQSFVGYGLAARFTVVNGLTSYYGLFISESGEFLLLKVDQGREQVLVDWTASSFIQANRENRIGLDLRGDRITAYINGLEVAAITDGSLKAGGYALLAGPAVAARFDNLEIRGFER